ncbi:MAG: hypothetical protein V2G48_06545 [bacterium JZ-2024 1]
MIETKKEIRECGWNGWQVTLTWTYKVVGKSLHHPKKIFIRRWCSHAARCKKPCLYNGRSSTRSPFPQDFASKEW